MPLVPIRIVPDTNLIRTDDNRFLFSKTLSELVQPQDGVSKRVIVAEITAKEIIFQKTKAVERFRDGLEKAAKTLATARECTFMNVGWSKSMEAIGNRLKNVTSTKGCGWNKLANAIAETARKELRNLKIKIIKAPVSKIKWKQIIDDAIWRRAPFEGTPDAKAEKGFRDAVFVESVLVAVKAEPDVHWCILSNDDKIVERLKLEKAKVKQLGEMEVFRTIEALEGHTKLLVEKYKSAAAKMLTRNANAAFFDFGKYAGLWLSESLEAKLSAQFGSLINEPPKVPVGDSTFDVIYRQRGFEVSSYPNVIQSVEYPSSITIPSTDRYAFSTFPTPSTHQVFIPEDVWHKDADTKFFVEGTRFLRKEQDKQVKWVTRIRCYSLFSKGISISSYHFYSGPQAILRETVVDVYWSAIVEDVTVSNPNYEKAEVAENNLLEGNMDVCLKLGFPILSVSAASGFGTRYLQPSFSHPFLHSLAVSFPLPSGGTSMPSSAG